MSTLTHPTSTAGTELVDQFDQLGVHHPARPAGPAAAPTWLVLTLTTSGGYLVLVQDEPDADWLVWRGPSDPDAAVSSLRYHDPDTSTETAAPVAVFPTMTDANTAWSAYLEGRLRRPRLVPYAMRVVPLTAVHPNWGPGPAVTG